jgi:taurine dioxygenase
MQRPVRALGIGLAQRRDDVEQELLHRAGVRPCFQPASYGQAAANSIAPPQKFAVVPFVAALREIGLNPSAQRRAGKTAEETMAQAQRKAQARDWPFQVTPLHPSLGCEISGITLAEAVDPRLFAKVYEAFLDYELILFRDVDLPPATQVAFARAFGEVQIHVMNQYHGYKDFPEIYMLSNLGPDGKPSGKHPDKGTLYWHTDGSWRERTGQATMMYSEIVPPAGGETEFADMYAAYDSLSPEMKKKIEGKRAIHNLDFSRTRRHGEDPMTAEQKAKVPPIAHPIVRTHPETGRKAIFLGDHAQEIEGMDYEEGRALIEELNRLITPRERVYTHVWKPRECMVWDNRCTLHRATGFDEAHHVRVMRRCTINGDRPY